MAGMFILASYFLLMMGATYYLKANDIKGRQPKESINQFLVGDRQLGTFQSAMSIAATWIWAPALFVSAEKAYHLGLVGLCWFVVPNVACLMIFAPFAKSMRDCDLGSVTLAEYMGKKYDSESLKKIYLFLLCSLAVLSTAVQLLAGGQILATMTGLPFRKVTAILSIIALSYASLGGIRASVFTDMIQMIFILVACAVFVPWALTISGTDALMNGLAGVSGEYTGLFTKEGAEVFFSFGLPTAIGLLAGPFGDQCFWQRAFSIKEDKVKSSFSMGAFIFAVAPLSMGVLGMVAAGTGFIPEDAGIVNVELVTALFPQWASVPFLIMLVSGLLSTVDSNLCAFSSLVQDLDVMKGKNDETKLEFSRCSMVALLVMGMALANIDGLTVTKLFLFYGTFRATSFLCTVATLKGVELAPSGICNGIVAGLVIGLPIFSIGNLQNIATLKTVGSLTAMLLPIIIAMAETKTTKKAEKRADEWRNIF